MTFGRRHRQPPREESRPRGADFRRKWTGAESNRRHQDFQSCALPTELPVPIAANRNKVKIIGEWPGADNRRFPVRKAADFAACGDWLRALAAARGKALPERQGRIVEPQQRGVPIWPHEPRRSDHTRVDQNDDSSLIDRSKFALTISRSYNLARVDHAGTNRTAVALRSAPHEADVVQLDAMRRVLVEEKPCQSPGRDWRAHTQSIGRDIMTAPQLLLESGESNSSRFLPGDMRTRKPLRGRGNSS